MKVTGPGSLGQTGSAKAARSAGAGPAFAPRLPGQVAESSPLAAGRPVSSVGSLDALIALQEIGGPLERRRRAVSRAGRLLDTLEALKISVLDGAVTPAVLQALAKGVREERSRTDDPGLEGVLDEIETRAMVEMAKLERAQAAT